LTAAEYAGVAGLIWPAWDAGRLQAFRPESAIAAMQKSKDIFERTKWFLKTSQCRQKEHKTRPRQRIGSIATACDSVILLIRRQKGIKSLHFLQGTNLVGFAAPFFRTDSKSLGADPEAFGPFAVGRDGLQVSISAGMIQVDGIGNSRHRFYADKTQILSRR
jgi:hypothetical protein